MKNGEQAKSDRGKDFNGQMRGRPGLQEKEAISVRGMKGAGCLAVSVTDDLTNVTVTRNGNRFNS